MTKARTVLQLLVEGPHSTRQLAEKTGLSIADVQEAIRTLRRGERVESVAVPVIYQATPEGERALAKEPLPPAVLARKSRERRVREQRAQTTVGRAISNQPLLARAWGVLA
jgi:DNA-binding transcriptional regulator YhcF (GntR family)